MSKLSYDDVLLVPEFSDVGMSPKEQLNVAPPGLTNLFRIKMPIISAAMDTVTEEDMAGVMVELGSIGVIHRNCTPKEQSFFALGVCPVGVAVGLSDDFNERIKELKTQSVVWVIDVAHAHRPAVIDAVKKLKSVGGVIIAGNVVTPGGVEFLAKAGVDAVKVGIGSGSICTTRQVTGVGYPQFSAVKECAEVGVPIIADGGVHRPGDMVKAFVAGASAVMLGNALAGTDEAPGDIMDRGDDRKFKVYRGMGSRAVLENQHSSRYFATTERTPEGVSGLVPYKGKTEDVINHFMGGLKSAMCYLGCRTLEELKEVSWVQVSPTVVSKNGPYDIFNNQGRQDGWT